VSENKLERLIETMESQMRSGKYNEVSFYMACKALKGVKHELNKMADIYTEREKTLIESRDRFLKRSQELQWMLNKMVADKNER
jgi:chaperonin cofactor prefoldin